MKKLLLASVALFFLTAGVMAQESTTKKPQPAVQKMEKQTQMITECCMMKNGKMMHYYDGKETAIAKEMDMAGMKIMSDGTCKMKDGKTMKLKEGECCDTKGVVHKDCQKLMEKKSKNR